MSTFVNLVKWLSDHVGVVSCASALAEQGLLISMTTYSQYWPVRF